MGDSQNVNSDEMVLESDDDCMVIENEVKDNNDESAGDCTSDACNAEDNAYEDVSCNTVFNIVFNKKDYYQKLKKSITDSIAACLKTHGIIVDFIEDENFLDICVIEQTAPTSVVEEKDEPKEEENLLFMVDTTPTIAEKVDASSVPSYKRSIKEVLKEDSPKPKTTETAAPIKMPSMCFNCGGNHSLKDCSEPRNQQKINRARRQFVGAKHERYHVDVEQRFAHLKPGKFSKKLIRALGLRSRDLPSFVYKMRVFGYPPGWLEDAKVANSGLALFDSEGREVLGSDVEDGEVETEKHKYDVSKIISFPGFNVDPGPDYYDDCEFYGVPPIHKIQPKTDFVKSLGDNIIKGYKRKKLKDLPAGPPEGIIDGCDMDIEEESEQLVLFPIIPPLPPPLPLEVAPPPPPPCSEETPVPCSPLPSILNESYRDSPSLEDLEAKKRQLLADLKSSLIDLTEPDDSLIDEVLELESELDHNTDPDHSKECEHSPGYANSPEYEHSENCDHNHHSETHTIDSQVLSIDSQTRDKTLTSRSNTVSPVSPTRCVNTKLSVLGTPLLKFSPYDKLPSGDSFKKGVSDVINFENLPDSTGKFEKMKVVIKKVRTTVTKLNEEN